MRGVASPKGFININNTNTNNNNNNNKNNNNKNNNNDNNIQVSIAYLQVSFWAAAPKRANDLWSYWGNLVDHYCFVVAAPASAMAAADDE